MERSIEVYVKGRAEVEAAVRSLQATGLEVNMMNGRHSIPHTMAVGRQREEGYKTSH